MIVVHVDRSVTVLSDVFCWQPLKHWHPCWSCLPSYQPDNLPLFRCMQCKNCPPMPSWVSCLRNAGGWFMNQEICKGVWDFGFSSYSFRVSFNYLCPNLTGRPQIWPYPRWWFGIVRNAPDTNTAWHILQQLTVDGYIFISWIDRCCHSSTGDQQIKLLSLDGSFSGIPCFDFDLSDTSSGSCFLIYLQMQPNEVCLSFLLSVSSSFFAPRDEMSQGKSKNNTHWLMCLGWMNATIYFRGSVIQYVWVPPRKSDIDTKHGHIQKESNHLFQSIMFEYPC